ncbi:prephenate dehydrogenase [Streptomyces sp. NPDC001493]
MIRTVAVVGTGMIGTSVGLALSRHGVRVHLVDSDPAAARVAAALGAGTTQAPTAPVDLAVLAVPPTRVAEVLVQQQRRGLAHGYTDVASVKSATALAVLRSGADSTGFVGGHPMAGSERSGPLAARADLFEGRSWVLTPAEDTSRTVLNHTLAVVALCGAVPVVMEPEAHDETVALVSHLPHLVSALLAGRLRDAPHEVLRLAGQGVRDVTRVAGGDPDLWADILGSNAAAVTDALGALAKDLLTALDALEGVGDAGASPAAREESRAVVRELLARGREGRRILHDRRDAGAPSHSSTVWVELTGRTGELGRLLLETAELGLAEDALRLLPDEGPGGLTARITAPYAEAEALRRRLSETGWLVRLPEGRPPDGHLPDDALPRVAVSPAV